MAEKQEQRCGRCKWFKQITSSMPFGLCVWRPQSLPESYRGLTLMGMKKDQGTSCPTYQAKESRDVE